MATTTVATPGSSSATKGTEPVRGITAKLTRWRRATVGIRVERFGVTGGKDADLP
jgi:hypothetical protein